MRWRTSLLIMGASENFGLLPPICKLWLVSTLCILPKIKHERICSQVEFFTHCRPSRWQSRISLSLVGFLGHKLIIFVDRRKMPYMKSLHIFDSGRWWILDATGRDRSENKGAQERDRNNPPSCSNIGNLRSKDTKVNIPLSLTRTFNIVCSWSNNNITPVEYLIQSTSQVLTTWWILEIQISF